MKADLEAPSCSVNFWTFAVPVLAGNLAAIGTGAAARALYKNEPNGTRETATLFARFGAFWLAAGLTWIAIARRNGAST